jgi:hypothetical protein
MFTNIVVGVDGRQGGRDAVALAERLKAAEGRLTLTHVYPGDASRWRARASTSTGPSARNRSSS